MRSADAILGRIARVCDGISRSLAERDRLIREARAQGVPLRTIARVANVSHTHVDNIDRGLVRRPGRPQRVD